MTQRVAATVRLTPRCARGRTKDPAEQGTPTVFEPDVRFEGFTATDWKRVLELFRPRPIEGEARDPRRARSGVILVHDGQRPRKLLHSKVGRLRLDDVAADWPLSAEELAHRHVASWAAVIQMGALERIMDRFARACKRREDLTLQALHFADAAHKEFQTGALLLWPHRLMGMPIPSYTVINRSLDAICPPGHAVAIGLFEQAELWTCLAMRRSPLGGFDLIMGPDQIRNELGLLAGDWRRDYRHLIRALEQRVGPLSLGCFSEVGAFRRLEVDPSPGAWARAVAVRDVILSPVPGAMALPLGIDAGRAAMSALRTAAEKTEWWSVVGPGLSALKQAAIRGAEERGFSEFEPLELLRRLLSRDQ